ncbi:MAG: diacylglycerol kinase family protein [Candidatus Paceibacterota bacterium]
MENSQINKFSLIERFRSIRHALRGVKIFFTTTHNAWIEISFSIFAILFGIFFQISSIEWMLIVLAMGLVLVAEAFNTAIEIDINLTSPEYHPYARDTKDVAAGAVFLMSLVALIVALIIFLPKIILYAKIYL